MFWVLFYFLLNALRFVTFEGRGALVLPNSIVYIIVVIIISFPFISLMNLPVQSWDKNNVPDWLMKVPLTKPGSTGK